MSRRRKDPLRALTVEEREVLMQIARASSEPASHVARAKIILAVAAGSTYQAAAEAAGRKSNDAVSRLVSRFNLEGLAAIAPRHGGGAATQYDVPERARILREVQRTPEREQDGTASWSLSSLQKALRKAADGLPTVSTYTIWKVLRDSGYSWQKRRSWSQTGSVERKRKTGVVTVIDPDTEAKKLIEQAYTVGTALGLAIWCHDQAGPYQTRPQAGSSWAPESEPARQPTEYVRAPPNC